MIQAFQLPALTTIPYWNAPPALAIRSSLLMSAAIMEVPTTYQGSFLSPRK